MYASTRIIQTLLDTRLATVSDIPTIHKENMILEMKNRGPYVRTTLMQAQPDAISIGLQGWNKQSGIFQIDVFTQYGYGYDTSLDLVDGITNAFIRGLQLDDVDSGVSVVIENAYRNVGSIENNAWYHIPVTVDWFVFNAPNV